MILQVLLNFVFISKPVLHVSSASFHTFVVRVGDICLDLYLYSKLTACSIDVFPLGAVFGVSNQIESYQFVFVVSP